MTGQPQQSLRPPCRQGLGVMSLINEEKGPCLGQAVGKIRPAEQLKLEIQAIGFPPPVSMQSNGSDDEHTQRCASHQSPRCQQRREGFAKAHLICQNRPSASQKPAGTRTLMPQGTSAIGKGLIQLRRSHQLRMGWKRWKRLSQPTKPLLQLGRAWKAITQCCLE